MKPDLLKSDWCIKRPLFSALLAAVLLIGGMTAVALLPSELYPTLAQPQIRITASYPGADAKSVEQQVAAPIEEELSASPAMLYMASSSSDAGKYSAVATFAAGTDPAKATSEIENRLAKAKLRLPAPAGAGISVEAQGANPLMTLALRSDDPKYNEIYLSRYAAGNLIDPLRGIAGVESVTDLNSRNYVLMIWLQPDQLANLGLTVGDLQTALADQNRAAEVGLLGQPPMEGADLMIPIRTQSNPASIEEFGQIVVRTNSNGTLIRLKDVARLSLESSSYNLESGVNGEQAAILHLRALPDADPLEVSAAVRIRMEELSRSFPEGVSYEIPFDGANYLAASTRHLHRTLVWVLILIVGVAYFSLQNLRATAVVAACLGLSLFGALGVLLLCGYSFNAVTLVGLTLASVVAVDTSLIVVQNAQQFLDEEHLSPLEAARKAIAASRRTLLSMALVVIVVFIPLFFLGGVAGAIARPFGTVLIAATVVSALVGIAIAPTLCSRALRPKRDARKGRLFRHIDLWIVSGEGGCSRLAARLLSRPPRRLTVAIGIVLIALAALYVIVPRGFLPAESKGYFTVELRLPDGATLEHTRTVTDRAVRFLLQDPDVESVLNVTGYSPREGSMPSRSSLTVILRPDRERGLHNLERVMERTREELNRYPESEFQLSTPPLIPGIGSTQGFEMVLSTADNSHPKLLRGAADTLMHYARLHPQLADLAIETQRETPQIHFDIDRDKTLLLGVTLGDVFTTMRAYTNSLDAGTFALGQQLYPVRMQADAPYRARREDLNLYFVRSASGTMIPLTALGTVRYSTDIAAVKRFNGAEAVTLTGHAARGYTSQEAIASLEKIVREHLPSSIHTAWSGLSYQEKASEGKVMQADLAAFGLLALLCILLWRRHASKLSILLPVLGGCVATFLAAWLFGMADNLFFQLGLVTLMGFAARFAVPSVTATEDAVAAGIPAQQAAIETLHRQFSQAVTLAAVGIVVLLPLAAAWGPGTALGRNIAVGLSFGMGVAVVCGALVAMSLNGNASDHKNSDHEKE